MQNKLFRPPLLHDHMDGCKTLLPVLPELFALANEPFPFSPSPEQYAEEIRLLFRNAQIDIVKKFKNTTGVMQCGEALELAAYAYTVGRAEEGYTYCEMTIAPQYHTFGGLYETEVVEALIRGIRRGESEFPKIEVNILFTIGRETSPEEGVRLVEAAKFCDRDYVVGIGLVCDENHHPPIKHVTAFRLAKALGFKTAIHAGEWVSKNRRVYHTPPEDEKTFAEIEREKYLSLQNIAISFLWLGADRVGHAITLADSPELIEYAHKKEIGIEWCPGSNFASGLIPNTGYLKIRELLRAGILGSINPDDDLFLPDMDETFGLCDGEYCFTENERWQLEMNAWATRFGGRKHHQFPFGKKI